MKISECCTGFLAIQPTVVSVIPTVDTYSNKLLISRFMLPGCANKSLKGTARYKYMHTYNRHMPTGKFFLSKNIDGRGGAVPWLLGKAAR